MSTNTGVELSESMEQALEEVTNSPVLQRILSMTVANILDGVSWVYSDAGSINTRVEEIKKANNYIVARRFGTSCLLDIDPTYLVLGTIKMAPGILTQEDVDDLINENIGELVCFEKFLIDMGKQEEPFCNKVGIYKVGRSRVVLDGLIQYPAYRLAIEQVLKACRRFGYLVRVGDEYIDAREAFGNTGKLFKSLKLSPSKTCLFLDIKSTFSYDKICELEKRWEASAESTSVEDGVSGLSKEGNGE